MNNSTKLSSAQAAFLDECRKAGLSGYRTPFVGGRGAGSVASGWYRTAAALAARGIVVVQRSGDAKRAWLPQFAPGVKP